MAGAVGIEPTPAVLETAALAVTPHPSIEPVSIVTTASIDKEMVPQTGVEPARCHQHRILSPRCLPVPPPGHKMGGLLPALGGHPSKIAFALFGNADYGILPFHQPRQPVCTLHQAMPNQTFGNGSVDLSRSNPAYPLGDFF